AYRRALADAANLPTRILAFRNKPSNPRNVDVPLSPPSKPPKPKRHIPKHSERSLKVPQLRDDFRLNLLDWSKKNVVSVAMDTRVLLLNPSKKSDEKIVGDDYEEGVFTSVCWSPDGRYITIGLDNSTVQIWDAFLPRKVRVLRDGHRGIVGHWLGTGTQTWGLWAQVVTFRFEEHTASVRALAWCPLQNNLLASGGGEGDHCIKLWNTRTGACLNSVDTGSQVCALAWNKNERELLSSHGFPHNQLTLWKYPSMLKRSELKDHTSRVLYMAQSPDGGSVATTSGDKSLRFWNVFETPTAAAIKDEPPFANFNSIR
ncbi:anaphase-promoting complex subunit cdc20-like protein, partial [Trifolium pratense]